MSDDEQLLFDVERPGLGLLMSTIVLSARPFVSAFCDSRNDTVVQHGHDGDRLLRPETQTAVVPLAAISAIPFT
jgi:hypothetical protein